MTACGGRHTVIVSCEHGGNKVPPAYAALFAGHDVLRGSHRGWDPGALLLATEMAAALEAPLFAATTTRLLVDLNRSIGHPALYSELTRDLPRRQRDTLIERHYRPHRDSVESAVANAIARGQRVIHVASHSFTPELHGTEREADVAWLYDPRRAGEVALSVHWLEQLHRLRPHLRLRRNYPYQGKGDGLTALLRKRHPPDRYIGIELEFNQRFALQGGPMWPDLRHAVIASLQTALRPPV